METNKFMPEVDIDWQTGEIPEPNGPSILILQKKNKTCRYFRYVHSTKTWEQTYNYPDYDPNSVIKDKKYTGKWFIIKFNIKHD